MIIRLERILHGLLEPINAYAATFLGVFTFIWGCWLVTPAWTVFGSAPVFSRASELAPEWAWGTWSIICGGIIVVSVFKGAYKWLGFATGFAIWHWWTIAGMCWWGDWTNTAGVTYSYIAIWTTYAWLNIKINFIREGHPLTF